MLDELNLERLWEEFVIWSKQWLKYHPSDYIYDPYEDKYYGPGE